MKIGENNITQDTPYPFHIEIRITNTIPDQTVTEICRKKKMRLRKQNPYLFLMIWIRNEAPKGFEKIDSRSVWEEEQFKEKMNSYKSSREN